MEMFNEELAAELRKLMIDHENEKKSPYDWWQGQDDFEHMKRVFMTRYLESTLYQDEGYSQKKYLEWLLKLINDKKKKQQERRERTAKKKKIKLNLEKGEEITGPIYDNDGKPTYYKW